MQKQLIVFGIMCITYSTYAMEPESNPSDTMIELLSASWVRHQIRHIPEVKFLELGDEGQTELYKLFSNDWGDSDSINCEEFAERLQIASKIYEDKFNYSGIQLFQQQIRLANALFQNPELFKPVRNIIFHKALQQSPELNAIAAPLAVQQVLESLKTSPDKVPADTRDKFFEVFDKIHSELAI